VSEADDSSSDNEVWKTENINLPDLSYKSTEMTVNDKTFTKVHSPITCTDENDIVAFRDEFNLVPDGETELEGSDLIRISPASEDFSEGVECIYSATSTTDDDYFSVTLMSNDSYADGAYSISFYYDGYASLDEIRAAAEEWTSRFLPGDIGAYVLNASNTEDGNLDQYADNVVVQNGVAYAFKRNVEKKPVTGGTEKNVVDIMFKVVPDMDDYADYRCYGDGSLNRDDDLSMITELLPTVSDADLDYTDRDSFFDDIFNTGRTDFARNIDVIQLSHSEKSTGWVYDSVDIEFGYKYTGDTLKGSDIENCKPAFEIELTKVVQVDGSLESDIKIDGSMGELADDYTNMFSICRSNLERLFPGSDFSNIDEEFDNQTASDSKRMTLKSTYDFNNNQNDVSTSIEWHKKDSGSDNARYINYSVSACADIDS
jgi:hypothetical protein